MPCGVPSSTRSAPASHSSSDALGDLLRRARDAEALERRRLARRELERRVEMRDDAEVRLDRGPRALARPVAVLVDDADRTRRRPSRPGCRASRARRGRGRGSRCRRASARPRPFPPSAPSPAPTSRSGAARESRSRGYESVVPGLEREALSRDAGLVAREQRARRSATASRSAASGRSSSMPSRSSHAPFARPRNARPPETASSIAIWPAISYGCSVNGLSAAGPSRIRSVTRAMSSSGPIAGWSSRSW